MIQEDICRDSVQEDLFKRRMGAQPGDELDECSFSLLQHLEENLTKKQSVDRRAEHFSQISLEYPHLDILNLSQTVQDKLKNRGKSRLAPYIQISSRTND